MPTKWLAMLIKPSKFQEYYIVFISHMFLCSSYSTQFRSWNLQKKPNKVQERRIQQTRHPLLSTFRIYIVWPDISPN
jgi:hypothetical protein